MQGPLILRKALYAGSSHFEESLVCRVFSFSGKPCMQGPLIFRKALYAGSSYFEESLVCRVLSFSGKPCMQGLLICRAVSYAESPCTNSNLMRIQLKTVFSQNSWVGRLPSFVFWNAY
jgi:hypothetical protein